MMLWDPGIMAKSQYMIPNPKAIEENVKIISGFLIFGIGPSICLKLGTVKNILKVQCKTVINYISE